MGFFLWWWVDPLMSYVPFIYSNMRFVRLSFMIKWRRDPVSFYVSRILSVSIGLHSSKLSDAINVMDNYLIKKSNLSPYFIDSIHFIMFRSVSHCQLWEMSYWIFFLNTRCFSLELIYSFVFILRELTHILA